MRLAPGVAEAILAHARREAPRECCGVLLGTPTGIVRSVPARNRAPEPSRFLIDPQDHINARRGARQEGLDLIGFYHSHPHTAALPSATDLAEAAYPGAVHLIATLTEPAHVRAFLLDDGVPTELPLTCSD